jgi:hypothetical protein
MRILVTGLAAEEEAAMKICEVYGDEYDKCFRVGRSPFPVKEAL